MAKQIIRQAIVGSAWEIIEPIARALIQAKPPDFDGFVHGESFMLPDECELTEPEKSLLNQRLSEMLKEAPDARWLVLNPLPGNRCVERRRKDEAGTPYKAKFYFAGPWELCIRWRPRETY